MPKELHDRLAKQAAKKGLKGKQANAYTFGTMHKIEKKSLKQRLSKTANDNY